MKRNIFFILILMLSGCTGLVGLNTTLGGGTVLRATCHMKDFEGFPDKVTGTVTIDLKNFLTILVENKDKTESIEITFPKSKCTVN